MFSLTELRRAWLQRLKVEFKMEHETTRERIVESFMRDTEALIGGKFKLVIQRTEPERITPKELAASARGASD